MPHQEFILLDSHQINDPSGDITARLIEINPADDADTAINLYRFCWYSPTTGHTWGGFGNLVDAVAEYHRFRPLDENSLVSSTDDIESYHSDISSTITLSTADSSTALDTDPFLSRLLIWVERWLDLYFEYRSSGTVPRSHRLHVIPSPCENLHTSRPIHSVLFIPVTLFVALKAEYNLFVHTLRVFISKRILSEDIRHFLQA